MHQKFLNMGGGPQVLLDRGGKNMMGGGGLGAAFTKLGAFPASQI